MPAVTLTRSIALITGASSGIGEALTHNFADYGHDLVLVARSEEKLKTLALALEAEHSIEVLVLPADLAVPGAAEALAATLKRRRKVPDVLVNCADVLKRIHGRSCLELLPRRSVLRPATSRQTYRRTCI